MAVAVACDVGGGELCATAGLFALVFGWGGLAGGNITFHKIRTAADATRATMNLCCCCIRAFFFGVRRQAKRRRFQSAHQTMIQSAVAAALCRRTPKLPHRIVTARAKRLTAQETPYGHATSAQRAMALDCFTRIFGTSRNKTTRRRQPRRDYCFVELQERNKNDAHR